MPPARPVLILLAIVALPTFFTFLSLLNAHPRHDSSTETTPPRRGAFRSFFSFHTPSTLFPPAAIISLTDDNSTFFLARPADFGPRLVSNGLSGQLWVGNGFGDNNIRKGGTTIGLEGELGCSDVPGWEDGDQEKHGDVSLSQPVYQKTGLPTTRTKAGDDMKPNKRGMSSEILADQQDLSESGELAGTDDQLHYPLRESQISKPSNLGQTQRHISTTEANADIQSLQETAEITGKIVMLSRGGCGFLEKVKWAQRRGAAALIVGDDTRGGALVTMYARGDTSNISIPSLFTSQTTAHLLSSLIPPEDDDDDEANAESDSSDSTKSNVQADEDRPNFTVSSKGPRPTTTSRVHRVSSNSKGAAAPKKKGTPNPTSKINKKSIWQKLGFGTAAEKYGRESDSRRPPSSGRLSWVNEKFNDEVILEKKAGKNAKSNERSNSKSRVPSRSQHTGGDGFEIGIQDWRDPDLVATKSAGSEDGPHTATTAAMPTALNPAVHNVQDSTSTPDSKKAFSGGSITPGSGEYGHSPSGNGNFGDQKNAYAEDDEDKSWLGHSLWGGNSEESLKGQEHEGLWITLTPTTMSTTPFFDTLLVLVASPLITLTVVYALLLLRSRIRRRRWRAPKSVVERLPIRTYQTMPTSSTTSSARMATPFTSSPTSPLLQSRAQSIHSRSRAQSKAGSEMDDQISVSLDKATAQAVARDNKKLARAAARPKKYNGRQVECVVCLEEYVEGHSQVMSLPCGHEFHADCITPWLTTRRRTCPICKNDVVRSMARSSKEAEGSPPISPDHDGSGTDDVQAIAAETTNESPSAAIPIPRDSTDVERGDDMADTLVEDQSGRRGWRGLASLSLSAFSGEAAWRQAQADRNR